jgi:DNA-binding transcriptional LysR family regulator
MVSIQFFKPISFGEEAFYSPLFEILEESGSFHPKQFIFVDNVEAMKRMAVRSIGVAFLPKMAVQKEIKEGKLVEVPFYNEKLITKQTYLIYKKRQFPNPTIQNFVSITKKLIARAGTQDEIWE